MANNIQNYNLAANVSIGLLLDDIHMSGRQAEEEGREVKIVIECADKKEAIGLRNDLHLYRAAHRHTYKGQRTEANHAGISEPLDTVYDWLIFRVKETHDKKWYLMAEERDARVASKGFVVQDIGQ